MKGWHCQVYQAKGLINYNLIIGEEFTQTCHFNGTVRAQERVSVLGIQVLDEMITLSDIHKRSFTPRFCCLDGYIGKELERVIIHLTNLHSSVVKISDYRMYR